jgi:hypothetical protein
MTSKPNRLYFYPNQDILTGTIRTDYFTALSYQDLNPATPGSVRWPEGFEDPILGSDYRLKLGNIDAITNYSRGDVIDLPGNWGSTRRVMGKTITKPAVINQPYLTFTTRLGEPGVDIASESLRMDSALSQVFSALSSTSAKALQVYWPAGAATYTYLCGRDERSQPWILLIDRFNLSTSSPLSLA